MNKSASFVVLCCMQEDKSASHHHQILPSGLLPYLPLVVFDGECGLCNRLSGWILSHQTEDPARQMFVVGAESGFGKELLQDLRVENLATSTIIFITPDALLTKMDASYAIWRRLRFPYAWIPFLYGWLPRALLNRLYDWIARNRSRQVCTIKDREWRDRHSRFVLDDLAYPRTTR